MQKVVGEQLAYVNVDTAGLIDVNLPIDVAPAGILTAEAAGMLVARAILDAEPETAMVYGRTLIWHSWQPGRARCRPGAA